MKWTGYVARIGICEMHTKIRYENLKGGGHLKFRWEDNIKIYPKRSTCLVHLILLYAD
jgi:hypothetical protein